MMHGTHNVKLNHEGYHTQKDGTAGACGVYGRESKCVRGLVGKTWTEM